MINKKIDYFIQAVLVALVAIIFLRLYFNVSKHLAHDNIAAGFGFLHDSAGFNIIQHLISFSPASSNLRAFFVGILNTLWLTVLAIILSTMLGMVIAIMRLSKNWLMKKLGMIYVDFFKNIPLLLQVFFWYFILLRYMPQADESIKILPGIYLNIRGLFINNFTLIPELTAMLLSLTLYAASYVSEIFRNGIISVDHGQVEAGMVCGLSPWLRLRLIILPQAAKVIIPPLVGQYLNILKNSSLGSAIGYPDLVSVFAGTVLNQTGQAIETIFMTMSFYLIVSMLVSYILNVYNHKLAHLHK